MSNSITPNLTSPYWGIFYGYKNQNPQVAQLSGSFIQFSPEYFVAQTEQEVLDFAAANNISPLDANQSLYFNLPNGHSVANIRRAGSTSLTTIIANTFFPDLSGIDFGRGVLQYSTQLPLSSVPSGIPHAIVRNPIDRFESAYAKKLPGVPSNLNVNDFINWLIEQDQGTLNWHFRPQTVIIGSFEGTKLYDFKTQLDQLASDIGLSTPLPTLNETLSGKPTLTQDQIDKLSNYYAADLTLYALVSTLNTNNSSVNS